MTNLRQLRQMARMSLQELSYKTGINRPKLSYAERGVQDLTPAEQNKILGVIQRAVEANAAAIRNAEDKVLELARA
jgi:transcriptional regulator with XRE-family HTH domain